MLKSINLSLSCICGADCIFCPKERGTNIKEKVMSLALAKKIIDELAADEFARNHDVHKIIIGENGDAFLNKELIEILRYIRAKISNIKVILYVNFQHLNKDLSGIILKEKLADVIRCNIDGSNARNYFAVKRLDYNLVMDNISAFLRQRKELKCGTHLAVSVLTLNSYIHTIYNNFKFYPAKLSDLELIKIKDDFRQTRNKLGGILDKGTDRVYKTNTIGAWGERQKIDAGKVDYKKYTCTHLIRIKHEAFIAPDGTWYACCLDSQCALSLGNIKEQSLQEVYSGAKRANLINLLEERRFSSVGGPCLTVNCCQPIHQNSLINVLYKVLIRNKLFAALYYRYFFL